jgi:aminopeptidase
MDNRRLDESGRHVDLLVDMHGESRIEIDGDIVQRDGTFASRRGSGDD